LVEAKNGDFEVLKEERSSQIDLHKPYGGIVPEVAARAHAELIMPLVEKTLEGERPDVIAVTAGPGLITALQVGVNTAAALSYGWDVPLVAVNHIEGHLYSNWLGIIESAELFPKLCLIVSGGHTELILMKDHGEYELVGKTRDDAAGEVFDKVGKLLGFEYPGGPKIAEAAKTGKADAIPFPRPMTDSRDYDFSFAGLKTAALYWLRDHKLQAIKTDPYQNFPPGIFGTSSDGPTLSDFCASFQQAIVETLVKKTVRAAKEFKPKSVLLGGGVAANQALRQSLEHEITTRYPKIRLTLPPLSATVDNAAMIAVAGYFHAQRRDFTSWGSIHADPNWRIESAINE
jgi:N6-L-threonylcarbamoyladenine synthase